MVLDAGKRRGEKRRAAEAGRSWEWKTSRRKEFRTGIVGEEQVLHRDIIRRRTVTDGG